MSSISSSSDGYSSYAKRFGDLEDDLRSEARRSREHQEEQTHRLKESYDKALEEQNREAEKAANSIRENSRRELERVRKQSRQDVSRARAKMYDKFGKTNQELDAERKQTENALQQMHDSLENERKQTEFAAAAAEDKRSREDDRKLTEMANKDRRGRREEVDRLHQKLRDLLAAEKNYAKEKGQGTVDARREIENEARTRERVLRDEDEQEIAKIKDKMADQEHYYDRRNARNISDRDAYYTKLIAKMNKEQNARIKHLDKGYDKSLDQEKIKNRNYREGADRALEHQAKSMNEAREKAMEQQAQAYDRMLADTHSNDQQEISRLNHALELHRTSPDPAYVSPEAEERMRRDFTQEYEKTHQAEVQRDMDRTHHLRQSQKAKLQDIMTDRDKRLTAAQRQYTSQSDLERAEFLSHVQDLEQSKKAEENDNEHQLERQSQALNHTYSNLLDRQRRDLEEQLDQAKADAADQLLAARQDAEFKMKMAHRNFQVQQNQLIRRYEKRIEQQKNTYEDQIAMLKEKLAHTSEEARHRTRQLLDEQSKGYEHRIAELQYQSKERERTMSDNYQDEIEKIKRENALLIQKKS